MIDSCKTSLLHQHTASNDQAGPGILLDNNQVGRASCPPFGRSPKKQTHSWLRHDGGQDARPTCPTHKNIHNT